MNAPWPPPAGPHARRWIRNRGLTELLQRVQFRWRHRGRRPVVLVHQMARVGSITVFRAVRRALPDVDVFHTHYLHPQTIAQFRAQFDRIFEVTGKAGLHREFLAAKHLRRRLDQGITDRWRVITLVRDPVARTVSAFLMHFPYAYPELGLRYLEDPGNVPGLIERFLSQGEQERAFTLNWFEREVDAVFGIDVFGVPFAHEAGHITFAGASADLLVLRLEDLDRAGPRALAAFLGTPVLPFETRNRSAESSYRATHARFLAELVLPDAYLDQMYDSRLARHFYRPEELAAFRSVWNRTSTGGRASPAR